ncbi:hypothetical protein [Kingella oralis]|jgi:hypothetical protein
MLTIQIIRIQWRPAAHNPACATIRNRLPRVLPLPDAWLDSPFGGIHQQDFVAYDAGGFRDNGSRFKPLGNIPPLLNGLRFAEENQTLSVWFADEQGVHGLPIRSHRHLFALQRGQTVQFRINGRQPIGYDDDVVYKQHTYNIAYHANGDERLFVSKPFDCSVSPEAVLF